jgi:single-stranded DNA-binding protein
MDYICKFKINGVVTKCEEQHLKTEKGYAFTVTKIMLEQQEDKGSFIKKNIFEIQIDFNKHNIMEGDTVEIEGFIKTNSSKDGKKHFTTLVGTECNVISRQKKTGYKVYQDTEQPEPNPCLNEGEDCPF